MKNLKFAWAIALFCALVFPSLPVIGQEQGEPTQTVGLETQDELWITIYPYNLASISDKRLVSLKPGKTHLEIPGISGKIKPATLTLEAEGVKISGAAFDFDLITPKNLLKGFLGKEVLVENYVAGDGKASLQKAILGSADGNLVLQFPDRMEILSGNGAGVIKLPNIPPGLNASPTLKTSLEATEKQNRELEISYMTEGFEWEVFYLAKIHSDEEKVDLQGWIKLTNETGTDFKSVNLQFFAGVINMAEEVTDERFLPPEDDDDDTEVVFVTSSRIPERLADFYLYTMPFKTEVLNNQEKKFGLMEATNVPIKKSNIFYLEYGGGNYGPEFAHLEYTFENLEENNLGMPLPTGQLNIYLETGDGKTFYLGEGWIGNTPKNEEVSFQFYEGSDLTVEEIEISENMEITEGPGEIEVTTTWQTMEVVVKNISGEPQTISLFRYFYEDVVYKITGENFPHVKYDANNVQWDIEVPAFGETVLRFSLEETEYDFY